jgi:hypothetical protein
MDIKKEFGSSRTTLPEKNRFSWIFLYSKPSQSAWILFLETASVRKSQALWDIIG